MDEVVKLEVMVGRVNVQFTQSVGRDVLIAPQVRKVKRHTGDGNRRDEDIAPQVRKVNRHTGDGNPAR